MTQPTAPQIQPTAPQVPLAPEVQPSAPKSYTNGFVKLPYSAQPNDPTAPPSYDMEKELANSKIQTPHILIEFAFFFENA